MASEEEISEKKPMLIMNCRLIAYWYWLHIKTSLKLPSAFLLVFRTCNKKWAVTGSAAQAENEQSHQ